MGNYSLSQNKNCYWSLSSYLQHLFINWWQKGILSKLAKGGVLSNDPFLAGCHRGLPLACNQVTLGSKEEAFLMLAWRNLGSDVMSALWDLLDRHFPLNLVDSQEHACSRHTLDKHTIFYFKPFPQGYQQQTSISQMGVSKTTPLTC